MRKNMRGFFTLAGMIVGVGLFMMANDSAHAQQQVTCETGAHYGDFDFWVGEWKVYDYNNPDKYQGHNSITKTEQNCLVNEHWVGGGGGTGFSMNFYNPGTDEWRQLWVSGSSVIDYTGGLNADGQMVLEGIITYRGSGGSFPFKGTWTAQEDGSVRQFFEQYDAENKVWNPWFDGLYIRDNAPATNDN